MTTPRDGTLWLAFAQAGAKGLQSGRSPIKGWWQIAFGDRMGNTDERLGRKFRPLLTIDPDGRAGRAIGDILASGGAPSRVQGHNILNLREILHATSQAKSGANTARLRRQHDLGLLCRNRLFPQYIHSNMPCQGIPAFDDGPAFILSPAISIDFTQAGGAPEGSTAGLPMSAGGWVAATPR